MVTVVNGLLQGCCLQSLSPVSPIIDIINNTLFFTNVPPVPVSIVWLINRFETATGHPLVMLNQLSISVFQGLF